MLFQTFAHVAGIPLAVAGYGYSRAWVQKTPNCPLLPGTEARSVWKRGGKRRMEGESKREGDTERKTESDGDLWLSFCLSLSLFSNRGNRRRRRENGQLRNGIAV